MLLSTLASKACQVWQFPALGFLFLTVFSSSMYNMYKEHVPNRRAITCTIMEHVAMRANAFVPAAREGHECPDTSFASPSQFPQVLCFQVDPHFEEEKASPLGRVGQSPRRAAAIVPRWPRGFLCPHEHSPLAHRHASREQRNECASWTVLCKPGCLYYMLSLLFSV